MNEAGRTQLDPQYLLHVAGEDAKQNLLLKAQLLQAENLLARYWEAFGDLPDDGAASSTSTSEATVKEPAK